ncbi:DUF1016 N-terminal domain-containing protein [Spirosoma sp. SC4-14]|uniref:DUF1016 N-terminal domain-containing protein n=1 Tax=Spirosoma sp. SC4-14 TaxID=3128900 RepID=UPI0030D316CA
MNPTPHSEHIIVSDIRLLIEASKQQMATSVNAAMSYLYWQVGRRVNNELDQYSSAETYGKHLVSAISQQLESEFGASFAEKNCVV